MKDDFLSVSEFAKTADVSIQAVYKRINKENSDLKPFVKKSGGKTLIDKAALALVYNKHESEDKDSTTAIEILKAEILEKNKQIEGLLAQLETVNKLLDQQQSLMLLDKQKILELEEAKTDRKSIFNIFKRKKKAERDV